MHTTFPPCEKQEIEGHEQEQDRYMNKNKNSGLSKEGEHLMAGFKWKSMDDSSARRGLRP